MPSPRCGFSFEAAFQLRGLKLTISVYIKKCYFPVNFVVFPFIYEQDCLKNFLLLSFQGVGSVNCKKYFHLNFKN